MRQHKPTTLLLILAAASLAVSGFLLFPPSATPSPASSSSATLCVPPAHILPGTQSNSQAGYSVAGLGSVNDDIFPDIMVGAPLHTVAFQEGWVYTYYGSSGGMDSLPDLVYQNPAQDAHYGASVSGAGDVNADGFDDAIIGAFNYPNAGLQYGAAFVHLGGIQGLDSNWVFALYGTSSNPTGRVGFSVSDAGDVNGDGFDDIIIGNPYFNAPYLNAGSAHLYYGSAYGIDTTVNGHVDLFGSQANEGFGNCVTGAGDLNGDGFDDIAIGASTYSNGQTYEGAVYVYLGDSSGLITPAAMIIESNQASAILGYAVSEAGDVNGDGFDDLAMTAYNYDNGHSGEGIAWVHHGGPNGLDPNPAVLLEVNQQNAFFGYSLDAVGDLNADGFDDIAVGSPHYDDTVSTEGIVNLYLGSPTGISPVPIQSLGEQKIHSWFGESVAGVGDVNQDGYDDVLVGVLNWYDTLPGPNPGAGLLYYGSPCGVSNPSVQQQFSICNGDSIVVGSVVHTVPGLYSDTLVGCNGCDSVVQTYLTVLEPQVTWQFQSDTLCIQSGILGLSALPLGGSFGGPGVNGSQFDPMAAGAGTHFITYQYTDTANGCLLTDSIAMTVDICPGLSPSAPSGLQIWPNPSTGMFRVTGLQPNSHWELHDVQGRLLMRQQAAEMDLTLDLQALPNGVYLLRATDTEGKVHLRKLHKN